VSPITATTCSTGTPSLRVNCRCQRDTNALPHLVPADVDEDAPVVGDLEPRDSGHDNARGRPSRKR
jgi:hypothetical protein